jgi:ABC-type transport system involved in multi-copper enzyme maturation permease subunit
MKGVLRVLSKELTELLVNPRILVLSFLVPPAVLLLVGQLDTRPPEVRVMMSGLAECDDLRAGGRGESPAAAVYQHLSELSYVRVTCEPERESDTFSRVSDADVDLLLNVASEDRDEWSMYIADTNPKRAAAYLELANAIRISQVLEDAADASQRALYNFNVFGMLPLRPALIYYPQAVDRSHALLPGTFALIACLLAFVLAAPSLSRERAERTLEVLLGAPRINGGVILAGKILFSVLVSLAAASLMLFVAGAAYGLLAQEHIAGFLLSLTLPVLSSSLLGFAVSSFAGSQAQTVMASAVYFFCLLLLTGFLYPLEASSVVIRTASSLLSLTYFLDAANAWFFGAGAPSVVSLGPLFVQSAAYSALAWLALRRLLRQI